MVSLETDSLPPWRVREAVCITNDHQQKFSPEDKGLLLEIQQLRNVLTPLSFREDSPLILLRKLILA